MFYLDNEPTEDNDNVNDGDNVPVDNENSEIESGSSNEEVK